MSFIAEVKEHWKTPLGLVIAMTGIAMEFNRATKPIAAEVRNVGWSIMGYGAAARLIKK